MEFAGFRLEADPLFLDHCQGRELTPKYKGFGLLPEQSHPLVYQLLVINMEM